MADFLPYNCPTFRTFHLVEPCQKNLAQVKALKEAKKHVGPLEKCVECKGKMLITVPPPKFVIEGLPAPENWVEERFVNLVPKEYVSPERKGWEPVPEVTMAPVFLKDVGEKEPAMPKKEKILPELPKEVTLAPPDSPIYRTLEAEAALEAPVDRYCHTHPMSIPLNLPKWAEMKEWLQAQAEENERTMTQQVMMLLKIAWRQGT